MEPRDNYHRKMFKELYERNVHKDNRKLTEIMADFYADTCPHCGAKKEQS